MNSVKCPQCGLVLAANSPSCNRCGGSLPAGDPLISTMTDRPERRAHRQISAYQVGSLDRDDKQQNRLGTLSRIPFLSTGLGLLLLVASRNFEGPAWPVALVLSLIVVASLITVVARKRSRNAQARLWPFVTTLVANSALLITFAVVGLMPLVGGKSPEWREYVSTDGGFTIQMPGEPEVSVDQLNSKAGPLPNALDPCRPQRRGLLYSHVL